MVDISIITFKCSHFVNTVYFPDMVILSFGSSTGLSALFKELSFLQDFPAHSIAAAFKAFSGETWARKMSFKSHLSRKDFH